VLLLASTVAPLLASMVPLLLASLAVSTIALQPIMLTNVRIEKR
jgi:hypothetical protein